MKLSFGNVSIEADTVADIQALADIAANHASTFTSQPSGVASPVVRKLGGLGIRVRRTHEEQAEDEARVARGEQPMTRDEIIARRAATNGTSLAAEDTGATFEGDIDLDAPPPVD